MTRVSLGESIEHIWVSWLDAIKWRQFTKSGLGSKLWRSKFSTSINMTRRFITSYVASRRHPTLTKDLATFCIFIGHTKSGGSLIGSLLDAHPNTMLADEEDVLNYVSYGFTLDQICHILIKGSRREAKKGRITARRLKAYSLQVPGQWQGRYNKLQVIGASKAGPSTHRLGARPDLLDHLRRTVTKADVRIIHIIRNPYDPISLMMMRSGRGQKNAIEHYFAYCKTLASIRAQTKSDDLLPIRYEDLISEPRKTLTTICEFLNLPATDEYLTACIRILSPQPQRSRHEVKWSAENLALVQQQIEQFDFLDGYAYDS
jgi:hypothetical protein